MKAPEEDLPDTTKWQPREDATEKLSSLLAKRCNHVENRILLRANSERESTIDNYDAGLGIEDIFREELSQLLPKRYSVQVGTIDDRFGKTAGDCDVIIFNELWFPHIKAGATEKSRKAHFPIESVYSVIEMKSTLTYSTLDAAMEKLVACHRLHRPTINDDWITENRSSGRKGPRVSNALYSAIVAINLDKECSLYDMAARFIAINRTLKRHEIVRALCVLGEGTITWGREDRTSQAHAAIAKFLDDYGTPIFPIIHLAKDVGSAFYPFANELLGNLGGMILGPLNLQSKYGYSMHKVQAPKTPGSIALPPGKAPNVIDEEDRLGMP